MIESKFNYPIGVIASAQKAKEYIENRLGANDEIKTLDSNANVDDIRQFRAFLLHRGLNKRVGIIYGLNKWSDNEQAMLLKIFEQLPEFNKVFYSASFMPGFVITTRSFIVFVHSKSQELENLKQYLFAAMREKRFNSELRDIWKIAIQAQSWLEDGIINQKEKENIFQGIGIDIKI